ncbi:MAG TPA: NUDIX hydrolase [Bifidobacterium pseudolongum subsp. globosum]|nr:NUDIX hydrolase [Bifidobacterium pseudolongum subsp. globosum]
MADELQLNRTFDDASDGVDMDVPASVVTSETVYTGAIFSVEDRRVALTRNDGGTTTIRRQVIHHAPCVVMLVHDTVRDTYLVEREYRAGANMYAVGLPAGLIDGEEDPEHAALRELREETGVVPQSDAAIRFDHVGDWYSSEGMTDELAHIYVLHLDAWTREHCEFDADEHVESAWVDWEQLRAMPITASNSMIAILHEQIRRIS